MVLNDLFSVCGFFFNCALKRMILAFLNDEDQIKLIEETMITPQAL